MIAVQPEAITLLQRGRRPHMTSMPDDASRPSAKPCPICGKPATQATRPFCSRRCADVDLNRWLSGSYVIAGREEEEEDGLARDGRTPDGKPVP